jgi:hypothetical protein
MSKNFFKDNEERLLWIRLNAEHLQYSTKKLNNKDIPIGKIGEIDSCMQISLNQLIFDESTRNKPRLSFEELVLPHEELFKLSQNRSHENFYEEFYKFLGGEDK